MPPHTYFHQFLKFILNVPSLRFAGQSHTGGMHDELSNWEIDSHNTIIYVAATITSVANVPQ